MKLINKVLFIEFSEMVALGLSEGYLKKAKSIGAACWEFIKDPADNRRVLIAYEKMKDKYKQLVNDHYGDPYEYIAKNPILNLVRKDFRAASFYETHTLPNGQFLDDEYQLSYTADASWLNMIIRVTKDKRAFKAEVPGITMNQFWDTVCELIRADKETNLPATRRNLLPIIEKYKTGDYAALISPKFGNKNAAKIGKTITGYSAELADQQNAIIRKLLVKHQNLDNAQVANLANIIFTKKEWLTVTPATILTIRERYSHLLTAGNRGYRAHRNEVSKQIHRDRPKYPLAMVTVDGWTAELLYQERKTDKKGNTVVNYNGRLVVVVILDPFTNYPLGYAIGERETTNLIRQANRNALQHAYHLFNEAVRPWQVQSDRYGIKQLTPFYHAMAHLFTPAAVGNAKSKVIEPYFKYLNKKYCQLDAFWSGFGVTSKKKSQPNTEYLDKIKHDMPDKASVYAKIERIIELERSLKHAEYTAAWPQVGGVDRCKMGYEQYLMVFGTPTLKPIHQLSGDLRPKIAGKQCWYETFDPQFASLNHLAWNIYYDEANMDQVLAIDVDNKYRFMLQSKTNVPMAIRDQQPEHFEYRNRVRDYNKARELEIIELYANDNNVMQNVLNGLPLSLDDHQEAALKLMFTTRGQQKEALQDAKGLKSAPKTKEKSGPTDFELAQQQYLMNKVDFNQYAD